MLYILKFKLNNYNLTDEKQSFIHIKMDKELKPENEFYMVKKQL